MYSLQIVPCDGYPVLFPLRQSDWLAFPAMPHTAQLAKDTQTASVMCIPTNPQRRYHSSLWYQSRYLICLTQCSTIQSSSYWLIWRWGTVGWGWSNVSLAYGFYLHTILHYLLEVLLLSFCSLLPNHPCRVCVCACACACEHVLISNVGNTQWKYNRAIIRDS